MMSTCCMSHDLAYTSESCTTSKYSNVDTRGNWIATDAAGLGQVPKRHKAPAQEPTEDKMPEVAYIRSVQAWCVMCGQLPNWTDTKCRK